MTHYFNKYKSQRIYYTSDISSQCFYVWYEEHKDGPWTRYSTSCLAHVACHKDCPWDIKDKVFLAKDLISNAKIDSFLYPYYLANSKGWKYIDFKYLWSRIIPHLLENDKRKQRPIKLIWAIYQEKLKLLWHPSIKKHLDSKTFLKINEKLGLLLLHPDSQIREFAKEYYKLRKEQNETR